MKMNALATAAALSDQDLLIRLESLAGREREASAELVAHLAALDLRPSVLLARGYSSLFNYCTEGLHLSEDAACTRIEAARACRRFPVILDLLAAGAVTLTTIRLLGRYLTPANHQAVLDRARGRKRRELDELLAELAPRPDVPTSVRKLPWPAAAAPTVLASPSVPDLIRTPVWSEPTAAPVPPPAPVPTPRPVVQATAPERYRVQFTIGKETHDKLRRLQELLRREILDGDPQAIVDRALTLLLETIERTKLGIGAKVRPSRVIRPETDNPGKRVRRPRLPVAAVRHVVWQRDEAQCRFVSPDGRRCTERVFLEFHHLHAYATGGTRTAENIALRCRRHNQYEAELIFGPHRPPDSREG